MIKLIVIAATLQCVIGSLYLTALRSGFSALVAGAIVLSSMTMAELFADFISRKLERYFSVTRHNAKIMLIGIFVQMIALFFGSAILQYEDSEALGAVLVVAVTSGICVTIYAAIMEQFEKGID